MAEREGVVKYRAVHREGELGPEVVPVAAALSAWRHPLRALGWIGQEAGRYEGYGFGNLSARVPVSAEVDDGPAAGADRRPFLVTGSQTGGVERLGLDGFALVERWDLAANTLWSRGPVAASSESLTHATLYQASPRIAAVFHVHAPDLWRRRDELQLPVTDPQVPYGTPEMAAEVVRAWRELADDRSSGAGRAGEAGRAGGGEAAAAGLLAMGGHEDGLLAWGATTDAAGRQLLDSLLRLE